MGPNYTFTIDINRNFTLIIIKLSTWRRGLIEGIVVYQLVDKFLAFYGAGQFIILYKRVACRWSLFETRLTQSISSPLYISDRPNRVISDV